MDTLVTSRKLIPSDIRDSSHKAQWSIGYLQAVIRGLKRDSDIPLYTDPARQAEYIKDRILYAVQNAEDIEHDLRIP